MSNFDLIAPVYDLLAKSVFFGRIRRSKMVYISKIEKSSKILVVGGGSGEIIEELGMCISDCEITFVELSSNMIHRAKARKGASMVLFVNEDFLNIDLIDKYDYIFCNYFLDLFDINQLRIVTSKLEELMTAESNLIVTDFQITKWWHGSMSSLMHLFFRWIATLKSRKLKNIERCLMESGFELKSKEEFYGKFIFSSVFQPILKQK